MSRLDDYRAALLAAHPQVGDEALRRELDARDDAFVSFVVAHGLGPLWHERTGSDAFRESRFAAEALYAAQEKALRDIDNALGGIEYAVIKGVANRAVLYPNPALRACYDIDVLVQPQDRQQAAHALVDVGFAPSPSTKNISRELVLSRHGVDIDLHWALLREGRLRKDFTADMLGRRQRVGDMWALGPEDNLFVLLVHPAFAKHLAGWQMGLHRVADLLAFLRTASFDEAQVKTLLRSNGVGAAAWTTLRWAQLLASPHIPDRLTAMMSGLQPGGFRRAWLDRWLQSDLSDRLTDSHWARLLGFSWMLHDTPGDALRAIRGRRRAARRAGEDLAAFSGLLGE
jgi:hypothetical protein